MKKYNKIFWAFVSLVALMFTACSEDYPERTPSPVPSEDCIGVYFPNTNVSTIEVEASVSSVELTIARMDTTDAAVVSLKEIDISDVFTIPETVSFDAGQKEISITVNFDSLEYFEQYKLIIEVDESEINPYVVNDDGSTNFILNVTQSDWQPYATGTFQSGFFETELTQELMYSEILDRYKLPNVWVTGYDYDFEWDGSSKAIQPLGTLNSSGYYVIETGYEYGSYGMIYSATDPDTAYTYYYKSGSTEYFNLNMKFYVSAGSFGWYDERYVLEERY